MAQPVPFPALVVQPGTSVFSSSSGGGRVGGIMETNVTTAINIGTGEDDLHTFSIPANTLKNTKDCVEWVGQGICALNGNTKTIKVYFGGTTIATMTDASGVMILWSFRAYIFKDGSNSQRGWIEYYDNVSGFRIANIVLTKTDTSAIVMKCTGEATSNSDITQYSSSIRWWPATP